VQVGDYIKPADQNALNRTFNGLSNVRFEYDSDVILDTSFANLDYISSMLKLENDFQLNIEAHTCDLGEKEYNIKLSERRAKSVLRYFVSKGVPVGQLNWRSHGASGPKVPNVSDETRSINRRVEFVIRFSPQDELTKNVPAKGDQLSYELVKEQ
jgi:OOP family OmpA-OmpF porin